MYEYMCTQKTKIDAPKRGNTRDFAKRVKLKRDPAGALKFVLEDKAMGILFCTYIYTHILSLHTLLVYVYQRPFVYLVLCMCMYICILFLHICVY